MKKNEVVEKKPEERFELLPTLLPDVQLKSEPGKKLDFPSKLFEMFYNIAQEIAKRHWKIKKLTNEQEKQKEKIKEIAKTNNGLRGVISERDNFNLTVSPSEKIFWNQEKLKQSLKDHYFGIVKESIIITVMVPLSISPEKDEKIIEEGIKKALSKLGIFCVGEFIRKEINLDVNEKKLNRLIIDKKIKLLPEAKKTEIIWKIRVDPIRS